MWFYYKIGFIYLFINSSLIVNEKSLKISNDKGEDFDANINFNILCFLLVRNDKYEILEIGSGGEKAVY